MEIGCRLSLILLRQAYGGQAPALSKTLTLALSQRERGEEGGELSSVLRRIARLTHCLVLRPAINRLET